MDLEQHRIRSRYYRADRLVTFLLPASYHSSRRRHAVLYLHDGSRDWLERGKLIQTLDGLMACKAIPPVAVVLPEPTDRTREYKLSSRHLMFLTNELVPFVDTHLRPAARPRRHAVHGVSLGGLVAVWLGLKHPELFSAAGGQGGAYWYWKQRVVREVDKLGFVPTRFHLVCGREDGNLADNRSLAEALSRQGIRHRYQEVAGRHSWACWRRTLPEVLQFYFA